MATASELFASSASSEAPEAEHQASASGSGTKSDSSLDSEARSRHSRATNASSMLDIVERVQRKLCLADHMPLPVKSHKSAVQMMLELRDRLETLTVDADRDVRMLLLYTGIAVHRRWTLSSDEEERSDLHVTLTLLFMLQVLCDQRARQPLSPEPMETGHESPALLAPRQEGVQETTAAPPEDDAAVPVKIIRPEEDSIERWRKQALWHMVKQVEQESQSEGEDGGWAEAMRCSPMAVARACLFEAARLGDTAGLVDMSKLGEMFMHCSALSLQYNMLEQCKQKDDSTNFLSLSSAHFVMAANNDCQEEKLIAIADAAESEAGQQVLRDMILSFSLPSWVVGQRRTPLLSREANAIATEHFTKELGEAHEAAMRGAQWSWQEDPEPLHKVGALMAGLCILLAGRGEGTDHIRKRDAFRGRAQFPFLSTEAPAQGLSRLGFVPHSNTWLVYSVDRHGQPNVQLKHDGFEGMCQAVLLLTRDLKS